MPGITAITVPNPPAAPSDLPTGDYPSTQRIITKDPVGPAAANRQHRAVERRTVTLATLLKQISTQFNLIDQFYLRRDGTTQGGSAPTRGVTGDMTVNGHQITDLADAVNPQDALNRRTGLLKAGDTATGVIQLPPQTDSSIGAAAARLDYVRSLVTAAAAPPGMYGVFAGSTPTLGWLPLDGTIFNTTGYYDAGMTFHTYASLPYVRGPNTIDDFSDLTALRTYMGSAWGGDGINSFGIPDARGRVLLGSGTGRRTWVESISITSRGTSYSSAPTIKILWNGADVAPPGGIQATAVAFIGPVTNVTGVYAIRLTNRGFGYTTAGVVTVQITGGGGTGAAATAILSLTARATGEHGGEESHTLTLNEAPPHQHAGTRGGGGGGSSYGPEEGGAGNGFNNPYPFIYGPASGGDPFPMLPPYFTGLWCVRY